jgi:hypothetical protein
LAKENNMSEQNWNPWKLTAIGLALVVATALVTGLVVANWTGLQADKKALAVTEPPPPPPAPVQAPASRPAVVAQPAPKPHQGPVAQAPGTPTRSAVEECNRYAANNTGARDKTTDTLKDVGVGALVGAAVGAAGGAIADGGKGAGKGAAIGGVLGAGGGTLYGLNENKKHDEAYRAAYARCMRSRGYAG